MKIFLKWMMFLLPFIYVFRFLLFGENEEIYVIFSLIIFLSCSIYIFIFYVLLKQVSFSKYMIIYGLIILYLAVSLSYMHYPFMIPSAISLLITYITIFFLSLYITYYNLFWTLYTYYSYGILSLCILLYILSTFSILGIKMLDNRFGWIAFRGEQVTDPNYFAVLIGLALFYFYFICIWKQKKINKRILYFLSLILLSYFLLATLSRGVVVVFILSLLFSFLVIHRMKTTIIFALYASVLIIIILVGMMEHYGSSQATSIHYTSFNRFLLLDTSNRLELWIAISKGFFHSDLFTILFGNGFQSGSSIGAKYFYGWEPNVNHQVFINPHNMFLQFLVEIGVIGSFILFIFFIILCQQVVNNLRCNNPISLHFIFFFLGVNLSLNIFGFRELILSFMVLLFGSLSLNDYSERGIKR